MRKNIEILSDSYLVLETKMNNDKALQRHVYKLLAGWVSDIFNSDKVQNHRSYCGNFYIPSASIYKVLSQVVGVSKEKLISDNMDMVHSNYNSLGYRDTYMNNNEFYIVLVLFYLWASRNLNSDHKLREDFQSAILAIIYAKIWSGQLMKYYRTGCDDKYALYVQQLVLTNKSKLRKYRTPTDIIFNDFIGQHRGYGDSIDLVNNPQKVNQFLHQIWAKVNAIFRRVTGEYMKAWKEGKSIVIDSATTTNTNEDGQKRDLVEKNITMKHEIDELLDEIKDTLLYSKKTVIPDNLNRLFRATPYMVSQEHIEKMFDSIHDDDKVVEDTIKICSFLLDYGTIKGKLDSVHKICNAGILNNLINNIITSRRDPDIKHFKTKMDDIIADIYKMRSISELGSTPTQIKYRKMYLTIVVHMLAKIICRQTLKV